MQIERILVPLDGSELSARAVPWACEIAEGVGAELILLGVVPSPPGRWGAFFGSSSEFTPETVSGTEEDLDRARHPISKDSQMASMEAEVKRLLLPIADEIIEQGLRARVVVGFGRPFDGILQHIQLEQVNLVIMSTHGHSGLHPYAYGGTADRVARHSPVPVMLVRPEEIRQMMPLPKLPGVD